MKELGLLRAAGLNATEVEPILGTLSTLCDLPVVKRRQRLETKFAAARAIAAAVRDAIEKVPVSDTEQQLLQLMYCLHPDTKDASPGSARLRAADAAHVSESWWRKHQEPQLLALLVDLLAELDHMEDLQGVGRRLAALSEDVPQNVAMYWLYLFRHHYFRMETSAYALQFDLMTALKKRRDKMTDWQLYLNSAVYWSVEFSFYRARFYVEHGPLWFAVTDEHCTSLSKCAELIEYHDAFYEDQMAKLRVIYARLEQVDEISFYESVREAGLGEYVESRATAWLDRCQCTEWEQHDERCEIGIVLKYCDEFAEVVEKDFELVQSWYRDSRFAAAPELKQRILDFRTPDVERKLPME